MPGKRTRSLRVALAFLTVSAVVPSAAAAGDLEAGGSLHLGVPNVPTVQGLGVNVSWINWDRRLGFVLGAEANVFKKRWATGVDGTFLAKVGIRHSLEEGPEGAWMGAGLGGGYWHNAVGISEAAYDGAPAFLLEIAGGFSFGPAIDEQPYFFQGHVSLLIAEGSWPMGFGGLRVGLRL